MATGAAELRLRILIDQHLRRYTEREVTLLTKEMEKDLLISLSQVSREIQCWSSEIGGDEAEMGEQLVDSEGSVASCLIPGTERYVCLERTVTDFVYLLGMKSLYVQHLTGNILVEVSEFLIETGRHWDVFIRMLCGCMHLAIIKTLPGSAVSAKGFGGLNFSLFGSDNVPKPKLENANWYTVSGIFRVLRNVLKYLSLVDDGELLEIYLESISSTLTDVPWCLLDGFFPHQHGDAESESQGLTGTLDSIIDHEQINIFLGDFVRFLCSLVQQSSLLESSICSGPRHLILPKIINLVPNLLRWCQTKPESSTETFIRRYLMHKLLVLMVRLSYHSDLECATLLSWQQLLHLHFLQLLQQRISRIEPARDNCLDGSPFLSSLPDSEVHNISSNSLHRLAVFLFLRCSFSLVSSRRHADKKCECDSRKKGLQDFLKWIEQQIPSYSSPGHRTCIEESIKFSISFVRLYMHEDDLLFKVLLQLLSAPLHGGKWCDKGGLSLQDEEQTSLFRLSNLLNPVNLFHIFLSELHYDHQVLLDYLISKDVGATCAEYLLRCLRAVCDSWNLFVEFPLNERAVDVLSSKKRKVLSKSLNVEAGLLSCSPENISTNDKYNQKHRGTRKQRAFEDAKNCLLSLKNSIANLHQKNLFPYNPQVLLNRLSRFQELCLDYE